MRVFKKTSLRGVLSFIIGTFIVILLAVFSISSFVRFVVIDPNYYFNILHINNSEKDIYEEITTNLDYALIQSNLPKELVDNIITEEEVKEKCDSQFENIIVYLKTGENRSTSIDTEVYLRKFDENLNNYVKDNSIKVDDNFNRDIKQLRDSLSQIIKNGIDIISADIIINSSSINKIASITARFNGNGYYIIHLSILVLSMILLIINYKDIYNGLSWIARAFIAAGILFTAVFSAGLISKFYDNVIIYTPYLKKFISEIVRKDVIWLLKSGIIILCVGIVIYVISQVVNYRKGELEVK